MKVVLRVMSRDKIVNKEKVAQRFLRGLSTYDVQAKSQGRVSRKLVEKLRSYNEINYTDVLEVGCCTGTLTTLLLESFPIERLYLNDLVPSFHEAVLDRVSPSERSKIIPLFGDIETTDIPDGLDLVVSSSTFQWLDDLPRLFSRIAESLKSSGYLAFSIFGPGTLSEFREITGIGLDYLPIGNLLDFLEKEYHIEEEESFKEQLFFSTPRDVLRHLQETGVSGVTDFRWTPKKLKDFEQQYLDRFGVSEGVPVTYMSSYIVASKRG